MTDAEKVIWRLLCSRQLDGSKFRRQKPIARYIVDFVCFTPRLVVEIDGGQHNSSSDYEDRRTDFLTREGFEILRFWNNEVLENREGVCERMREVLRALASAAAARQAPPSPREGRGKA